MDADAVGRRERTEYTDMGPTYAKALGDLTALIADDGFAITFQTLGQYRTALLKSVGSPDADTADDGAMMPFSPAMLDAVEQEIISQLYQEAFDVLWHSDADEATADAAQMAGLTAVYRAGQLAARPAEAKPAAGGEEYNRDDSMHEWFELSYAQYLSVPRSIIQEMPTEWQSRFRQCLEQMDEAFDWRPKSGRYWVRLKDGNGRFVHDPLMEYRRPNLRYIASIRTPAAR